MVDRYAISSTSPEPLLRAILAKNPSRDVRGIACLELARAVEYQAGFVRVLHNPDQAKQLAFLRPAVRDYLGLNGENKTDWSFVAAASVPAGVWKNIVTTDKGDSN